MAKLPIIPTLEMTLQYSGNEAEENRIDFYDAAQALVGFERVISLTTHLILNDEVIVQSPSLKGAHIIVRIPEDGSWKITAGIVLAGSIFSASMAPRDSAVGHLMVSAYDYVVSETLGFHVDFDSTLGQQYEALQSSGSIEKKLDQSRFDSVIEKSEAGIKQIHRPIVFSESADRARIYWDDGVNHGGLNSTFNTETYLYVSITERREDIESYCGVVTSFNSNTYKGRIYIEEIGRPVRFEISPEIRDVESSVIFVRSLLQEIRRPNTQVGLICFKAFRNESRTGNLKSLYIIELEVDKA